MSHPDQPRALLEQLRTTTDYHAAGALWAQVKVALKRSRADQLKLARIVNERSIDGLAKLLDEVAALPPAAPRGVPRPPVPAPAPTTSHATEAASPEVPASVEPAAARQSQTGPGAPPQPDTLRAAMRAFKKRIKLMKLDEESKLGVGPMSGGKKSQIVGIIPPNQYPRPVWEELAAKGSLRHTGGGFYEFVKDYEGH